MTRHKGEQQGECPSDAAIGQIRRVLSPAAVSQETGRGRLGTAFDQRRWPALIVLAVCAGLASAAMAFGTAPLPAAVLLGLAA